MERTLANFDIDGTMITMWPIHEKVYEIVIREIYGIANVNFRTKHNPGDTNQDVVRTNLEFIGVPKDQVEKGIDKVPALMDKYYSLFMREGDVSILPGVRDLLKALKEEGICLGVVTGNRKKIANMILQNAGILGEFDFVIGADDGATRREKLVLSIQTANNLKGGGFLPKSTFYFDDSALSISVSKELGITSIAVGTGETREETLLANKPDYFLMDLSETKKVVGIINSAGKFKV